TSAPERFVRKRPEDREREVHNVFVHTAGGVERIFAHGRDPNFDGWTDTVQLDYRLPATRRAMADLLLELAGRCDGVRCDMAMLVNRDVFLRTWGGTFRPPLAEFWPSAITDVKARYPGFLMLAEVYWDMEWDLQQMGFDYTYDKRLYDRLRRGEGRAVREHLRAHMDYQNRLTRFIENHDEDRALAAFGPERARAAAVLSLTLPGMRLFHVGQMEGFRVKVPVQLGRRPREIPDPNWEAFYRRLVRALRHRVFHEGAWHLLEPGGNESDRPVVAHLWETAEAIRLVVVNNSAHRSQTFLPLDSPALAGGRWTFEDLLSGERFDRTGDVISSRGLDLDLTPYGSHLYALRKSPRPEAGSE
ncbi:MAG: alpha-amylase family glycosyl hydrolase, partial [Planctomycetota bacterium]